VHGVTPVLLLIHGFPEFWYEWRYQIGPWVRHGWRVVVPDTLGYGGTDKPDDASLYTPTSTATDMASLLTALGVNQPVVVVAHDWGAATAWSFAIQYQERTRALVSVSVPYHAPMPPALTVALMVQNSPNLIGYWTYLTSPDGAKEIQGNLPRFFDMMYRSRSKKLDLFAGDNFARLFKGDLKFEGQSDVLSKEERDFYIKTFEKGGIDKPLNYYRAIPFRYEQEQALGLNPNLPSEMPILLIAPKWEPFPTPERIKETKKYVPSLEVIPI